MTDSRLTIIAETQGTAQAAADLQKVAEAQQRLLVGQGSSRAGPATEAEQLAVAEMQLREATSEVADAQENLVAKQEKLHASERTYLGLLRQVSPTLAYYVEGMLRSVKVAGDLAAKNLELNDILKAGTGFLTENANGLALLGAGGAVVLGISAISSAVAKMGRDFEEATKAMQRQQDAISELKKAQHEERQTIAEISDRRREGRPSAEVIAQEQARAQGIAGRFGGSLKKESIDQAMALLGDLGLSDEEQAQAAYLIGSDRLKLDEKDRPAKRLRDFRRAAMKDKTFADLEKGVGEERGRMQKAALAGESEFNVEEFIKTQPGGVLEGMDAKKLAKIREALPAARGRPLDEADLLRHPWDMFWIMADAVNDRLFGGNVESEELDLLRLQLENMGVKDAGPEEIRAAEFVEQQMKKARNNGTGGPNVTIDNSTHNYTEAHRKMIVPGRRAQEEAMDNGAARARAAEE